jgi:hypothetical protein
MELNAKLSSLEDEVKLLKGEVKLILSEIRAAILGQNNPFSTDAGQSLYADPAALAERPPIRVVKVTPEDEEEVALAPTPPEPVSEIPWSDEADLPAPEALEEGIEEAEIESTVSDRQEYAPPRPVEEPAPTKRGVADSASPSPSRPASLPKQEVLAATCPQVVPNWSLIKVAGLMVWAEEALKHVGPERLQILLDLCEFAGYLPKTAKEALTRVMNLGLAIEERKRPPSTNECLVILYQLHALMQDEETSGLTRGRARASR